MLVVLLLAAAVMILYGLLLFPRKPTVPATPRLSAPRRSVLSPSGGAVVSEPLYARLVIAEGEHRSEPVTVDLRELSCALLARLVTIADPAVIGQGRLLVRVHESRYATCAFRHPDDFWPERDEDLTHLHVLWTDGQALFHGVLQRPDPTSPRIADWLGQELWAVGLTLPEHQVRAHPIL